MNNSKKMEYNTEKDLEEIEFTEEILFFGSERARDRDRDRDRECDHCSLQACISEFGNESDFNV